MYRTAAVLALLILMINSCSEKHDNLMDKIVEDIRKEINPLDFSSSLYESDNNLNKYYEYYGLDFPEVKCKIGYFISGFYKIAVQLYKPENPIGTVTVVHGYYDHVAIEKNLIGSLLEQHYSVVVFDLPGHGFSSGDRADITDFKEYSTVLDDLTEIVFTEMDSPHFLIGHSTGCTIIIDGLLKKRNNRFSKIILVSPLIHSNHWFFSIFGNRLLGFFTDSLPRVFRNNSSDKDYLDFVKNKDPLQFRRVPLNWFQQLVKWNDEISLADESEKELLVIQGDKDSTVDWKYNMKFIEKKFSKSEIVMIKNADHQLFNENKEVQSLLFKKISNWLKQEDFADK